MASIVYEPSPGMPKKLSMMRLPMKSIGNTATVLVKIGNIAFLSTCTNMTRACDAPLARAVLT